LVSIKIKHNEIYIDRYPACIPIGLEKLWLKKVLEKSREKGSCISYKLKRA
jgi:hypothetical protein